MTLVDAALLVFLALGVAGAALAAAAPRARTGRVIAWIGAPAGIVLALAGVAALVGPTQAAVTLWTIPAIGALVVRVDHVSGFFLAVTGIVLAPASVFAASSLPALAGRYNSRVFGVLHFALAAAVAWIFVAADTFSFLVAWELMSVLTYLLVGFEDAVEPHRRAAYLMLAMSEAGFLAATVGLLLLASHAGSLEFARMAASAHSAGGALRMMVFLLTFFGFGIKAGLVPLNVWLPRAYAAAPSPFLPVLAGITLNLGLYGLFRVNADLLPASSAAPGVIALLAGAASALVGILYATTDNDLKTLLAHSSIENAGIITVGFGAGFTFTAAGRPALAAMAFLVALYHLLNHSCYKSLLVMGAGIVDDRAGTRDLDRLGGLIRRMPWTAAWMLAGALSIAALPPFGGFVSEWLTMQTLLRSAELGSTGLKVVFALAGAGIALTAALAVTCFVKFFAMGFLGMTRSPEAEAATETTRAGLVPLAALAVVCLALGVLPTYTIGAIDRAVQPIAQASARDLLVPPFFAGSPDHATLPPAFVADFHDLGAEVGEHVLPGRGLVILQRGGESNPVVFAASPSDLVVVLGGLLFLAFIVTRRVVARRARVAVRACWDGGIRRLLPEMTYTATGFSNPVRVIFQAVFRPTTVEDTRETVAEHFRTAIRRDDGAAYIADRLLLRPVHAGMLGLARRLALMHHGRLNAYLTYALLALVGVLLGMAWVR